MREKHAELNTEIEKLDHTSVPDSNCLLDMAEIETSREGNDTNTHVSMQDFPKNPTSDLVKPLIDVVKDLKKEVESL